ncbi:MAG: GNAT family N-acetyltransferase [Mobilitalea sp.]
MELYPRILYTDGKNDDFIQLTKQLDQEFNDRFGLEQKQFDEFNTLEDIHDVILLYEDMNPIACGSFKQYDADTAEIKRVFVRKEYRGKGLSKLLLLALEGEGKKKGFQYFILETGKPLVEALASYKSMGYRVIPNYEPYIGIEISVCMKKQI